MEGWCEMWFVIWYDNNTKKESGGFSTYEKAESWMNNNLDSSVKCACITYRGNEAWAF